jgi:CheY-like chemotaxis protein
MPAPRILLVNGSRDERERQAEALRRRGFCTLQASTTRDACRIAAELPPTAVVTDALLENGDNGLSLARRLKQAGETRDVPVVVLTEYPLARGREAAARSGCDLFLTKPCQPELLSAVVTGLLSRRRRE